jgi:hypothetical protein
MEKEEINEKIHEKVFGECWHEWQSNSMGDRFACVKNKCLAVAQYGTPDKPDYCGSISDAWKVVERITSPPQTMEEAHQAANTKFMFWWQTKGQDLWCFSAEEAAEAICLAALKAIEGNL